MLRSVALVALEPRSTRPSADGNLAGRKAQRCAEPQRVVVVERRNRHAALDGEAALVAGVFRAVTRASLVGVVGRRAGAHEREAVGVMVGVEQVGELRAVSAAVSEPAAPNTTGCRCPAVRIAAGTRMRSAMPAASASSKSIIHFMPASIGRLVVGDVIRSSRRLGIRARPRAVADVAAGDRQRGTPAGVHDRDPAIGHQARLRRAAPRRVLAVADHRCRRKLRRRQTAPDSAPRRPRGDWPVGRPQRPRDPRRAARAEPIGELPPGVAPGARVVAGAPVLAPSSARPTSSRRPSALARGSRDESCPGRRARAVRCCRPAGRRSASRAGPAAARAADRWRTASPHLRRQLWQRAAAA